MDRARILQTVKDTFRDAQTIVAFSLGRVRFGFLAIPLVLIPLLAYGVTTEILSSVAMTSWFEPAAIVILVVACAIAAWRWHGSREPYFLWLTCLVAALVVREIHLKGTSWIFDIGVPVLFYIAVRRYALMADYFASPRVLTLMAFVWFTYGLSQLLDWHVLAFVPHERYFERPTEECIEVIGHLAVVLLAGWSRKGSDPLDLRAA